MPNCKTVANIFSWKVVWQQLWQFWLPTVLYLSSSTQNVPALQKETLGLGPKPNDNFQGSCLGPPNFAQRLAFECWNRMIWHSETLGFGRRNSGSGNFSHWEIKVHCSVQLNYSITRSHLTIEVALIMLVSTLPVKVGYSTISCIGSISG